MEQRRALRHGALLLLFFLLLGFGILFENAFDSGDGGYAADMKEQRDGGVPLSVLFHTPTHWRNASLALNRSDYPYVTDAFVAEYLTQTPPPQLKDVSDNRTLLSDDFYEELQLWRQPGRHALHRQAAMKAQVAEERVVTWAEAVRRRRSRPWHTTVVPKSSWWPAFLSSSRNEAAAAAEDGAASLYVEVDYETDVLYHGSSGAALGAVQGDVQNGDGGGAAQRKAVALETDAAQLVPFPFVPSTALITEVAQGVLPPPPPPPPKDDAPLNATTTASHSTVSRVRIDKGRLRHTVLRRLTPHTPTHGWSSFFIALNLWKNEAVLPDLTEALIAFLEDEVRPYFNLTTSVVVSIYANVSPDRTAELIESILIPRLHAVGVRAVYATIEGACLGYVKRQPFHERIEWMACIRNKALAPLYEDGMRVFPSASGAPSAMGSDGLVVLFFNDIFFRPQDITTLLESRVELQMSRELRPHGWLTSTTAPHQSSTTTPTIPTAAVSSRGTTFDMACGMDFYFTFYDTWVTRDRLGNPLQGQMPYSDDHATQDAFYRIFRDHSRSKSRAGTTTGAATAAVSVKSCWNGVAAIRGRFFLPPTGDHRVGLPDTPPLQRADLKDPPNSPQTSVVPSVAKSVVTQVRTHERAPRVWTRASGALYYRLGTMQDAVNTTGLADYYSRVLARRLHRAHLNWNRNRDEIAALTAHPYYQPVVYANMFSFAAVLSAVLQERGGPGAQLSVLAYAESPPATLPAATTDATVEAVAGGVEEDTMYYAARHPALRFRHAFTPSYGATVRGLKPVRDDVCLSSECLLICQDVAQAAILQDRRAPLILLNPHVRVAYDLEHFERVMRNTWFFENAYVYWAWVVARRVLLWWSSGSKHRSAEVREWGSATSAMDDWLRSPAAGAAAGVSSVKAEELQQSLTIEDGAGRVQDVGLVDVATLTHMACHPITAGYIELTMGALFSLIRLGQLLLVALLLRWLCWSTQADLAAKLGENPTDGATAASWPSNALTVEERWWRSLYSAVWLSQPARKICSWVDALAADDGADAAREELSGTYTRLSGGARDAKEVLYMGGRGRGRGGGPSCGGASGGSPSPLPSVPCLHLQLWQHYRRHKLAVALGSYAHGCRYALRSAARALIWALGLLCCVRCWCGIRTPGPPPAPGCCAETKAGAEWTWCEANTHSSSRKGEKPPRRRSPSAAKGERSSRGEQRSPCSSVPQANLLVRGRPAAEEAEYPMEGFGAAPHYGRGIQGSSPGLSPLTTRTVGVFRDLGGDEEVWVPQLQQPPQQLRRSPILASQTPPPPPASQTYFPMSTVAGGTDPIIAPPRAPRLRSASDITSPHQRSDRVGSCGGDAGGDALHSVRPRNALARVTSSYTTSSPRPLFFGAPSGGRPRDGGERAEPMTLGSEW